MLLKEFFENEIKKYDENFFKRLQDSKFYPEDKVIHQKNTLFNDQNLKDKEFHEIFPSIYHLRYALYKKKDKFDLRYIYLAIHHIVKKRGHFLFDSENLKQGSNFDELKQELMEFLKDEFDIELDFDSNVKDILTDKNINKTKKKNKLKNSIKLENSKIKTEVINLLLGAGNLKAFFPEVEAKNNELKISISDENYEEKLAELESKFGEKVHIVQIFKNIYDYILLEDIMEDSECISQAKVKIYKKHKDDLILLKKLVKDELKSKYYEIFKSTSSDNYASYSGHWKDKTQKEKQKRTTRENFLKYIKKHIKDLKSDEAKKILESIENDEFMPRLIQDNSVIPHQIHQAELERILENAQIHYPFISEVKDKIIQIFKFRVPFYVGPLNDFHKGKGGNAWIEKTKDEKIMPWNFDKIVDKEKSAQKFIEKMTNFCTYLKNAKVLPKYSLLYSKFSVLNEINNLKINGEKIKVSLKQEIYENIFKKQKAIKKSTIKKYLLKIGKISKDDEISGVDNDLTSSLKSQIELDKILGDDVDLAKKELIIENIAYLGYDKNMLRKTIEKMIPTLSKEQLDGLCKLKYSGFGRLSKELLSDIKKDNVNIITTLWQTNENLMQILSDKFQDEIEKYNHSLQDIDKNKNLRYKMLDELYVSPSVKRQIWQALKLTDELTSVIKNEPKKIFIEMAREEGIKKRTSTRKKELEGLYKSIKDDDLLNFDIGLNQLNKNLKNTENSTLNSKKLYLYYKQLGVDLYTGKAIDISSLFDKNIYDIDHIIPRSIKKDDSFDNLVLTNKTTNARKTDVFPLSLDIQKTMKNFWQILKVKKLISPKKYENLTRTQKLTDDERADFIARQLVETRQGTKALAQILKAFYPNTEIVYVKAGNISEFRQKFDIIKCRELNNLHHAKDAYLNIVIGNAYNIKFTKNPRNFFKNYKNEKYNLKIEKLLEHNITRAEHFGWDKDKSIDIVKKVADKNTPLVTYMSYEQSGQLFDLNAKKAKEGLIPLKSDKRLTDTSKYGGYSGKKMAYFFLVEYQSGNKKTKKIESVPIYLSKDISNGKITLSEYCKEFLNLKNPTIKIPKILKNTIIKVDGMLMAMTGNNKNNILCKNITELLLSKQEEKLLKSIFKIINLENIDENKPNVTDKDLDHFYDLFLEKHKKPIFINRPSGQIQTLENAKDKFKSLSLTDKCIVLTEILKLFDTTSKKSKSNSYRWEKRCRKRIFF